MICICGGGTGGHLAIARALGAELKRRGVCVIFVGSQQGQDKMWFENSDIFEQKYFLASSGVANKSGFKRLFSLLNIIKLSFACLSIFKKHKIKAVISVGGYSAAPAAFAAIASFKPLFIHEQNAHTGSLNALLKPLAKKFFCSYDKNEAFDYPVRQEFFALARIRSKCECVLFLGGSQGASAINALALALAPILNQRGVKIIHQCGAKEYESVRAKYDELGIKARIYDFSQHLPELMSRADVCVSRAGASSLWELCANALPSVFIPYPYAAGDHQYYNAKFLADLGLAGLFRQESLEPSAVLEFIDNMDLASISASLKEKINSGGSQKIIDEVLKNIKI